MKLVTNSNNINTLKLIVSSNVAKVSLETKFLAPAKVSVGVVVIGCDGLRL